MTSDEREVWTRAYAATLNGLIVIRSGLDDVGRREKARVEAEVAVQIFQNEFGPSERGK